MRFSTSALLTGSFLALLVIAPYPSSQSTAQADPLASWQTAADHPFSQPSQPQHRGSGRIESP